MEESNELENFWRQWRNELKTSTAGNRVHDRVSDENFQNQPDSASGISGIQEKRKHDTCVTLTDNKPSNDSVDGPGTSKGTAGANESYNINIKESNNSEYQVKTNTDPDRSRKKFPFDSGISFSAKEDKIKSKIDLKLGDEQSKQSRDYFNVGLSAKENPTSSNTNNDKSILRKDEHQSFIIADKLLEGKSGQESVHCPVDEIERVGFVESRNKRLKLSSPRLKESDTSQEDSFLDIFLSDLNEINEIPFFDMELPRELAIKIFWHLDAVDLCHCSQVSKAWKSLAEDELLWCRICGQLGYDETATTREKSYWKEIVKEHVLKEKQLRMNWKTRTGDVEALEFVQGGILCAVHVNKTLVAAGYSSGKVSIWDLAGESHFTLNPSSVALVINESAEAGTIANMVTGVCVNERYVSASYKCGNVDMWNIEQRKVTDPKVVFDAGSSVTSLESSCDGRYLMVTSGSELRIHTPFEKDAKDLPSTTIECEGHICHSCLVPSTTSDQRIAISHIDHVLLHQLGRPASEMTTLHNTIGHYITCMDCNSNTLALGINADEHFRLKIYDLQTCREGTTFHGHTLPVSAVNLLDSPPMSVVTGCRDRKVRVYDTRLPDPVIVLRGHCGVVCTVQMDDWKVVSGCNDGMVSVWDQRMATKLWEQHNRHPVQYLSFTDQHLLVANIPVDKTPERDTFDTMYHKRYRGTLCSYDFSVDMTNPKLPSNVYSTYEDPEGYNYNISLAVPYDAV